jgi:DNA-binding XRE family transcriptional regulator
MADFASALKVEIARVARKQARQEVTPVKAAVKRHRAEIAALKRQVVELSRALRAARRQTKSAVQVPAGEAEALPGLRFRSKGLASHRKRLGLSAAELGKLLGVSGQSVYLWEAGKGRPRPSHMPRIAALRTMGKRQVAALLAQAG